MNFKIIKIELNELCSDTEWNPKETVDLDLISGEILLSSHMGINNFYDYQIEIKYYEDQAGEQIKVDYLEKKQNKLYLSNRVLKFLNANLLKDKIEDKLKKIELNNKLKDKETKVKI